VVASVISGNPAAEVSSDNEPATAVCAIVFIALTPAALYHIFHFLILLPLFSY